MDGRASCEGDRGVWEYGAVTEPANAEDYVFCADLVRKGDPDRFACLMLARETERRHLCALYAFNLEVARTREAVREALLGEIRLQWWRDVVAECYAGSPRRHQVVQPLHAAIEACSLPRATLDAMIDARAADLYPDPPVSEKALQDYVSSTGGAIGELAALCAGLTNDQPVEVGTKAGEAWAWVGLARGIFSMHRQDRHIVPDEWGRVLPSLEDELEAMTSGEGIRSVVERLTDRAKTALESYEQDGNSSHVDRHTQGVVHLTKIYLKRLAQSGCDPLAPGCAMLGDGARAWHLLRIALFTRR